tara:strand:+ start:704 stop:1066 length:363 start_codon:yes stop_codon:yes gene_type:complete
MIDYDDDNIFSKILKGEIPCDKVYEDENILCFKDINPIAKIHVLIIPKEKYVSFNDFVINAGEKKISYFFKTVEKIAKKLNIIESGYRIITNHGMDANQEVPHFHLHLLGKENLGGIKYK